MTYAFNTRFRAYNLNLKYFNFFSHLFIDLLKIIFQYTTIEQCQNIDCFIILFFNTKFLSNYRASTQHISFLIFYIRSTYTVKKTHTTNNKCCEAFRRRGKHTSKDEHLFLCRIKD